MGSIHAKYRLTAIDLRGILFAVALHFILSIKSDQTLVEILKNDLKGKPGEISLLKGIEKSISEADRENLVWLLDEISKAEYENDAELLKNDWPLYGITIQKVYI